MGRLPKKADKIVPPKEAGPSLDVELATILAEIEAEMAPDELLRLSWELQWMRDRDHRAR